MCVHAQTCGSRLALEHTGDLYSCDHYAEPGHLLSNIGDKHMLELVGSPAQRKFGRDKHDTLTRYCRDCDVRFACQGGCPRTGSPPPLRRTPPALPVPGLPGVLPPRRHAMCALLRAGPAAAELMASYAVQDSRRGRNDPCPCGPAVRGSTATAPGRPDEHQSSDWVMDPRGRLLKEDACSSL